MKSINLYEEIKFNNVIQISLRGSREEINSEVESFYSCLKEKGINVYPHIIINHSVNTHDDIPIEESEILVLTSEDGLRKVDGVYKTHEELAWNNVAVLEYNGVPLEFQKAVKEFRVYIEKNQMKTISGFYTYIPDKIKGADMFTKKIDMNCFVKLE